MKKYFLFIVMGFMCVSNGWGMERSFEHDFILTMYACPERQSVTEALRFTSDSYDNMKASLRKIDGKVYTDRTDTLSALAVIETKLVALAKEPRKTKKVLQKSDLERYGDFYYDVVAGYIMPASEDDDTPEGPRFFEVEVVDYNVDGKLAAQMAREIHALQDKLAQGRADMINSPARDNRTWSKSKSLSA